VGLEALGRRLDTHDCVGAYSGELVIMGGGRCLWDDLAKINGRHHDFMAVNHAGLFFKGKLNHWYTNEGPMLPLWETLRRHMRGHGDNGPVLTHTNDPNSTADYLWNWSGAGSSSLGAVLTGLALGYDKIILCGIPLDNSGHFYDPPGEHSNFINEVPKRDGYPRYWQNAARDVFDGKVKAVSGRLIEVLGELD